MTNFPAPSEGFEEGEVWPGSRRLFGEWLREWPIFQPDSQSVNSGNMTRARAFDLP